MSRVNITSSVPTLHVFCKQLYSVVAQKTRRALGRAHLPPTKVFRQLSERNHFITTARSSGGAPYVGFSRRKILRSSAAQLAGSLQISVAYIGESNPDYDLNPAQKLISSSMSRHLRHATFHPNTYTRF